LIHTSSSPILLTLSYLSFLLMPRPPPSPTLFPYTTLFRSASGGVWKSENAGTTYKPVFDKQPVQSIGAIAIDPTNPKVIWVGTGDRKSTRLNSSHVAISYAVFCLKKKKN